MTYHPEPVEAGGISLSADLRELTELLARNAHDVWARLRFAQGWHWGPERSDARKEHPSLVPYEDLPESEKQADRDTAIGTLKAILALGYSVEKRSAPAP